MDEYTRTFEEDGTHIVIPTVVNGKRLTADAAWKLYKKDKIRALGWFESEQAANNFAEERSRSKGHGPSRSDSERGYANGGLASLGYAEGGATRVLSEDELMREEIRQAAERVDVMNREGVIRKPRGMFAHLDPSPHDSGIPALMTPAAKSQYYLEKHMGLGPENIARGGGLLGRGVGFLGLTGGRKRMIEAAKKLTFPRGNISSFYPHRQHTFPHGHEPSSFIAYHASPHKYEKASTSRGGTGAGGMFKGSGFYAAQVEDTSGYYKKLFGKRGPTQAQHNILLEEYYKVGNIVSTKELGPARIRATPSYGGQDKVLSLSLRHGPVSPNWAVKVIEVDKAGNVVAGAKPRMHATYPGKKELKEVLGWEPSSHMYKLRINAKKEDLIDFDRPMKDQSTKVKLAFKEAWRRVEALGLTKGSFRSGLSRSRAKAGSGEGDALYEYRQLSRHLGSDGATSSMFKNMDIPGARFLDAKSRTKANIRDNKGTSNYVIFDDRTIDILKRYGIAALVGGGVTAGAAGGDEPKNYANGGLASLGYADGGGVSTHTVRSGDIVSRIARDRGTTTEAIKRANPGLDVDNIRVGQKIIIPGGNVVSGRPISPDLERRPLSKYNKLGLLSILPLTIAEAKAAKEKAEKILSRRDYHLGDAHFSGGTMGEALEKHPYAKRSFDPNKITFTPYKKGLGGFSIKEGNFGRYTKKGELLRNFALGKKMYQTRDVIKHRPDLVGGDFVNMHPIPGRYPGKGYEEMGFWDKLFSWPSTLKQRRKADEINKNFREAEDTLTHEFAHRESYSDPAILDYISRLAEDLGWGKKSTEELVMRAMSVKYMGTPIDSAIKGLPSNTSPSVIKRDVQKILKRHLPTIEFLSERSKAEGSGYDRGGLVTALKSRLSE